MTFYGRGATNVYLHKRWNEELRLFEAGHRIDRHTRWCSATAPQAKSRRAARPAWPVGTRVYGNWRHTEFTSLPAEAALAQRLPDGLTWDDGVDIAQMGPDLPQRHRRTARASTPAGRPSSSAPAWSACSPPRWCGPRVRIPSTSSTGCPRGSRSRPRSDSKRLTPRARTMWPPPSNAGTAPRASRWPGSAPARPARSTRRSASSGAAGPSWRWAFTRATLGPRPRRRVPPQRHPCHLRADRQRPSGQTWRTLRSGTIGMGLSGQVALGGLPRLTLPVEEAARGFAALAAAGRRAPGRTHLRRGALRCWSAPWAHAPANGGHLAYTIILGAKREIRAGNQ